MTDIFILAAGYGKRMGSLTMDCPKPLLKIDGISFLDYSLYLIHVWGIRRAWINVHYLGEKIIAHLKPFKEFTISISHEKKKILGTAGGIKTALVGRIQKDPILVFNPDTLLFPLKNFRPISALPPNSKMHLYLSKIKPNENYTKINISSDACLEFGFGEYYYIGLSLLDPSILDEIEPETYFDLGDIFKKLSITREITGELFPGNTLDLGEKELFEKQMNQNTFGNKKEIISDFISKAFRK